MHARFCRLLLVFALFLATGCGEEKASNKSSTHTVSGQKSQAPKGYLFAPGQEEGFTVRYMNFWQAEKIGPEHVTACILPRAGVLRYLGVAGGKHIISLVTAEGWFHDEDSPNCPLRTPLAISSYAAEEIIDSRWTEAQGRERAEAAAKERQLIQESRGLEEKAGGSRPRPGFPDSWVGKIIHASDHKTRFFHQSVDNPGGFAGFAEGEQCALGSRFGVKVQARISEKLYWTLLIYNEAPLPPKDKIACVPGVRSRATVEALSELAH